ncbi:MAG: hypothetical protein OEZ39_05420 [Gammaproteobacteria bacterium]|nr:hypothetical protein [Gammaproteobacteria bacterium]
MKITLYFTATFLVFISIDTFSYEFKYDKVFTCGPKKLNPFEGQSTLGSDRWKYYFFNVSNDGNFVILHHDIQWTSFAEMKLHQLYHQNGGIFTAEHNKENGIDVYKLINKEKKPNWVDTVMVNLETMTYTSRVSEEGKVYQPTMGVCSYSNIH